MLLHQFIMCESDKTLFYSGRAPYLIDSIPQRAPMPTRRAGLGVASGGDAIYAVGGERFLDGEAVTLAAVERYDPVSDAWTQLPDLPVARHGVAAAWVDQALYAIGGSIAAGTVMNLRTVDRIQAE